MGSISKFRRWVGGVNKLESRTTEMTQSEKYQDNKTTEEYCKCMNTRKYLIFMLLESQKVTIINKIKRLQVL